MTARELLRVLLRRWYLVALGAVLSLGLLGFAWTRPPVYWTQFQVLVLSPIDALNPNSIEDPPYTLPPVAGLVAGDYNDGHAPLQLGSPDTTLYGEGVRRGSRVRLVNNGTQWRAMYNEPALDVQVVDGSPEAVAKEADRIRRELSGLLDERQDEIGVRDRLRLTTRAVPEDPVIHQVGGSRMRVGAAMAVAGASMTILCVYWLELWLRRRRREEPPPASPVPSRRPLAASSRQSADARLGA